MPSAMDDISAAPIQGSALRIAMLRTEISSGETQAPTMRADAAPRIKTIQMEPPSPWLPDVSRD